MKRYVSSDELKDLPKYASCGLIRFKMTMFRETTYRYQFFFFLIRANYYYVKKDVLKNFNLL